MIWKCEWSSVVEVVIEQTWVKGACTGEVAPHIDKLMEYYHRLCCYIKFCSASLRSLFCLSTSLFGLVTSLISMNASVTAGKAPEPKQNLKGAKSEVAPNLLTRMIFWLLCLVSTEPTVPTAGRCSSWWLGSSPALVLCSPTSRITSKTSRKTRNTRTEVEETRDNTNTLKSVDTTLNLHNIMCVLRAGVYVSG